jgi:hypothetical protein
VGSGDLDQHPRRREATDAVDSRHILWLDQPTVQPEPITMTPGIRLQHRDVDRRVRITPRRRQPAKRMQDGSRGEGRDRERALCP